MGNRKPKLKLLQGGLKAAEPRVKTYSPPTGGSSPDVRARDKLYGTKRWKDLRFKKLADPDHKVCWFCGGSSSVLEHLIGHGADALDVAQELGFPRDAFAPTWQERFWRGPFVGSCIACARQRTARERHGDLLGWTKKHMRARLTDVGGSHNNVD